MSGRRAAEDNKWLPLNVGGLMWAACGEADIRTVVDTCRLSGADPFTTILATVGT